MAQPSLRIVCHSEKEYRQRLLEKVCSDDNTWLAGVAYGRPPKLDDCFRRFKESGELAEFEATHELRIEPESS